MAMTTPAKPAMMRPSSAGFTAATFEPAHGFDMTAEGQRFLAANPHMKFFNQQRGYVRVNVNRERWQSDFRVMPYVTQPGAPVSTRASFVVEDRIPGVQNA